MKKIFALLTVMSILLPCALTCAADELATNQQTVEAPKWEEYVPYKYQNPVSYPDKKDNVTKLIWGIALTDFIIPAPIGIPMIVKSSNKIHNQGWYEKKQIYEAGLIEAEKITDPQAKAAFYEELKKKCNFKESEHKKQLKRIAKENKNTK